MATSVGWRALVAGMVLMLAGCGGSPAGVDGDLVGDWSAMPEPELTAPEVGAETIDARRQE